MPLLVLAALTGARGAATEAAGPTDAARLAQLRFDQSPVVVENRGLWLDEGTFGFALAGDYGRALPSANDPAMAWSSYVGGMLDEFSAGLAVDGAGNIVLCGATDSSGWAYGGFDTNYHGNRDIFVAKLGPWGQLLWSADLGGAGYDHGAGVVVDNAGCVILTGYTSSGGWTSGGFNTNHSGGTDAFVVKLSPSGAHVWSTYLGGTNEDWGWRIAVDEGRNIFVTGSTLSPGWTQGGLDTNHHGDVDAFVIKLNPQGTPLWSTYIGGQGEESGNGIAVDSSGDLIIVGTTKSAGWTRGGFDTSYNGVWDGFVVKLNSAGDHVWSTYLGGTEADGASAVALDQQGNILVCGTTQSSGWTKGGFDTTYNGDLDTYVAKLDPRGVLLWSTYLGGAGWEAPEGVAAERDGAVLVTGTTYTSGWIWGGFQTTYRGGGDAFMVKLGAAGAHLWSSYLGGSGNDEGRMVRLDGAGYIVANGYTKSDGWVGGGFDVTLNGGCDAFVVKIYDAGSQGDVPRLLGLTPLSGAVKLTFQATDYTLSGFAIEGAASLSPPIRWSAETNAVITTIGPGRFEAQVALNGAVRFYRVRGSP